MQREQAPMNENVSDNSLHMFGPKRKNPPVSEMGQEMEGMQKADQVKVLRNSPMTESSLMMLGAGQPYKSPLTDQANAEEADND